MDLDNIDGCHENSLSSAHNKVYKWLNTHTNTDNWKSKSSMNLNCSTASDTDYQMIYRAKSELDLSAAHRPSSMNQKNMQSSLHTSFNCLLPSIVISPIGHTCESKLNESITEENSLIWDNWMANESLKVDSDAGMNGNESDTKELSNQLCYFGDDYSLHLNEMNVAESELDSSSGMQLLVPPKNSIKDEKTLFKSLPSSESLPKESNVNKRSRRSRKKRSKNATTGQTVGNSMTSLDQSSKSSLSVAATASAIDDDPVKHSKSMRNANQSTDEFKPETTISYNSNEKQFELHTKESPDAPKKMKINEMRPEDFYDIVKMCQSNIDCVITVLGADPNRTLTLAYCQQMKFERYQKSNDAETTTATTITCKCEQEQQQQPNNDATDLMVVNSPRPMTTHTAAMECKCKCSSIEPKMDSCICTWVSHTIAMILNFLMDCWNVFRNMKLYTYLCRVTKALFGSTRYVADHLRSKHGLANAKAIKYS